MPLIVTHLLKEPVELNAEYNNKVNYYPGQPVLARTQVKSWRILLQQSLLPICSCWKHLEYMNSGDVRVFLNWDYMEKYY